MSANRSEPLILAYQCSWERASETDLQFRLKELFKTKGTRELAENCTPLANKILEQISEQISGGFSGNSYRPRLTIL